MILFEIANQEVFNNHLIQPPRLTNHSAFDNMLDVRTTSRVVELADTGKMAQLEKGRTFDSYADFIKEVELYEEKTCTKFVKRGAKTVAAKKEKLWARKS